MVSLSSMVNGPVSIYEVDSSITRFEQLLSTSSRSDRRRLLFVLVLALLRSRRYELSNQSEDYDKSIIHFTHSILLQPHSLELGRTLGRAVLPSLFVIAGALVEHSKESNQPEGAIYAAKYLRYLRDHPHGVYRLPHQGVTASLMDALACQVELEARNVMGCIQEMAVLCHELLTLEASDYDISSPITRFARAVASKIKALALDQPLDQVIECLRLAREHRPDVRMARYSLAWSLVCRYCTTFAKDDYEEAVAVSDEFIASGSAGDDELVTRIQEMAIVLAMIRSVAHGTPEYSEEAIYRVRTFPRLSSEKDSFAGITAAQRFRFFGSIEGPEKSSGNSSSSGPATAVPFGRHVYPEVELISEKLELLNELISGIRNLDITEIGEAVEIGRAVLPSESSASPNLITSSFFLGFCEILFQAFLRTNKTEYINESISTLRQLYELPSSHFLRFRIATNLSMSLLARFLSSPGHRTQDQDEMVKILSECANNALVSLPDRFRYSCYWAYIARLSLHPSVPKAYETAFSLMQDTLLFAPTLQQQHATLADPFFIALPVSLDYASYQVDLDRLEEAVETLERGRALLWSEMRHLRASIDQLQQEHPQLGHEFVAINKDLEELTKSIPPSHKLNVHDDAPENSRAVDPFGRFLLKQRELLKERDSLTSRIRALPGFHNFLTSPSFNTLTTAASSGPVIIINHSIWRSGHSGPSSQHLSIPYPDPSRFLRPHYDETLTSVLAELYDLLQVPEQSRIWWCPTSVFCFLPLHAMGPIPSDDDEVRYFLDFYICSYTPTLSALIQSRIRDPCSLSSDRPSILLVAQPDPSLPTAGGEAQVVQALDTEVESLISEAATPAAVIDGFRHHRFVHLACHGTLKAGKPFEAGFELYGDKRLTLLEIVRSDLSTAEFAFLSACHTAGGTEMSITDEILHLAAAVQYCGFRSVVGTMWAMADVDGQELAKHFYKALFSNSKREQGGPYYERSAKALWVAVRKLRKKFRGKKLTLERWVNFVHYGA
ncbi:CHAT domain-containing protein [Lactarius vividus]|nr:CHAT domain-containing protein [Lactarius vividus]